MIVRGVRLGELSMSDMLDVLHYLFEEDSTSIGTGEHLEARDAVRSQIYSTMYGTEYKYAAQPSSQVQSFDNIDDPLDDEMPVPIDPFKKSGAIKPFRPATKFDPDASLPFGNVLDAPLG